MSRLAVFLISFLLVIPFVHGEPPAATQATVPAERPVEQQQPAAKSLPEKTLSFEEYFSRGTKNYQDKKYPEATSDLLKALDFHPDNPSVLADLGLSYFQIKKKGLSVAMFRRALFIDPSHSVAEAGLKFVLSQLDIKEIPRQIETYEKIRSGVLSPLSLNGFQFLTALFLFCAGFLWLRYAGRRRKALEQQEALPGLPITGFVMTLGFICFLFFTILKIYDLSIPRGTVIADKVSVLTAPGDAQGGLFDLYEGFEVIIRNSAQDWVQVTYPGGLTGWVKKDTLMATSSKNAF